MHKGNSKNRKLIRIIKNPYDIDKNYYHEDFFVTISSYVFYNKEFFRRLFNMISKILRK